MCVCVSVSLFLTECVSLCESLCLYGCAGVVCVCEAMSITVVLRLFRGHIAQNLIAKRT